MKKLPLFITLIILITSNLSARENPFEPTQTYETELSRLMEIEEDYPYEFQEKEDQQEHKVKDATDVTKTKKEIVQNSKDAKDIPANVMPVKDMAAKKEVKAVTKPMKKMAIQEPSMPDNVTYIMPSKDEEKKEKTITLEKAMSDMKKEKIVVEVPERSDLENSEIHKKPQIHENKDILPFVNVEYTNNKMQIASKHEVFRKFIIEGKNKIVLDYHAKTFFMTKTTQTNTDYFQKVIAGNHLKQRYFRIVVVVKHKPSKYKVTYSNNLVTIEFDKDMI